MKMLRLIHSMQASGGGPAESVRQWSAALREYGVETEIACLDAPGSDTPLNRVMPIHCLGPGTGSFGYSKQWEPWVRRRIGEFDAMVIQGLWNYHSWGTWRVLDRVRSQGGQPPPYFVYAHGMLDPWFKRTFPLKHIKKLLYWNFVERKVLRDASAVIFTSEDERVGARQSFRNYSCREAVVPHGICQPRMAVAAELRDEFFNRWPHLEEKRILLFLGRLHPKKGPDLLIEAFGKLLREIPCDGVDNVHLVFAGQASGVGVGPGYQRQLAQMAADHCPIGTYTFTGMLNGNLKWGAFHACEAFVLPSHQENFGIAVAEALACGKPVLISDKVNIWREIVGDEAGKAQEDTVSGTLSLLRSWFNLSAAKRDVMGTNARRCFDRRFEIGQAAKRLIEVIECLPGNLSARRVTNKE